MTDTTQTPSPETSTLTDDDPRRLFAVSAALARTVIDRVVPDQYAIPTPCGMEVRDLLEHLVMVVRRVAAAGRGEDPWSWPVDAADVADDGFAAAWSAGAAAVDGAWADEALLARPTAVPWGEFPGAEVLGVYINEVTVHTWDLAQATGQFPAWDGAVLAFADAAIHAQLPMADRSEMWAAAAAELPPEVPWEDPFGPAVPVAADAPAIDRLVAWNGRTP